MFLAGCLSSGQRPAGPAGADEVDDPDEPAPPENERYDPGWPPVEEAQIRPGVPIRGGSCTAAFVLASPDNRTLYVATAGHCVKDLAPGDEVTVAGTASATVVFQTYSRDLADDFALLAVDDEDRATVHPALRHFGGPTGMATDVDTGDKVLTVGASSNRNPAGIEAGDRLDPREGYVRASDEEMTTVQFVPPSVWQDSGSPVVTAEGGALGIVAKGMVTADCPTMCNGIVDLEPKLEEAADAGVPVELETWEQQASGLLPPGGQPRG